MSKLNLSQHAAHRINHRLSQIITIKDIALGVTGCRFHVGETWIKIKQIGYVEITDGDDLVAWGDTVYIIVHKDDHNDNGTVVTVELRNNHQSIKGDYLIDRT